MGLCEPLFLSRCCWWARQAWLPLCAFLQSCLVQPASSEDRALPRMLRRAAEFAATRRYLEKMSGTGQVSGNWKPWIVSTLRPLCSKIPLPRAWLVEVAHPCPSGWEGAFNVCPTGHSHWLCPKLCVSSHCAKDYRHTTTTMMGYHSTACMLERISAND